MNNGPHWRAAEMHDLAAHAHRVAAAHLDKQDHATAHEQSRQAMEHSAKAHRFSQEAHQLSEESTKETGENSPGSSPAAAGSVRGAKPVRSQAKGRKKKQNKN